MGLIRYFADVDMRNGHSGLRKLAKSEGLDLRLMISNEYVIFVNKKRNMLKMFASYNVIAHLKLDNGTIDPRVIAHIPTCFQGNQINYPLAVKKMLTKEYPKFDWKSLR